MATKKSMIDMGRRSRPSLLRKMKALENDTEIDIDHISEAHWDKFLNTLTMSEFYSLVMMQSEVEVIVDS